ncbi:hypothetical protein KOR34_02080 [Posidoniimonas corsicana]|uniref:Uncharacterized protein n=1 Tax=Posidoniimonas corsicana TaxID=1938618 RepID=A0A5C5V9U1_9BACT|nr:hypothetical protein [Posidoniimonas corsicana]TWT35318.1 hypothetical protein KOR34_02080 [Posidoniimonas corsicana]
MSHVNDRIRLTTASDPVDIGLVTAIRSQLNSQLTAPATGAAYDRARRVVRQEPTVSFTTEAIKQALDLVGLQGLCFDADDAGTTHKEFRYLANRLEMCGTEGRADDDVHLAGVSQRGLVLLDQLQLSPDQAATLSLTSHLLTNATGDAPLAQAYDQALAAAINLTQNPDAEKAFAFYGFTLLDAALAEVTSVSIQFNYEPLEKPREPNGTIWPSKARVGKYRQTIDVNLSDPSVLDSIVASIGEPVTQADTELQLVQIDPDGHWVDPASSAHIKIPIAGKVYVGSAYQADGEGTSTSDITIETASGAAPLLLQTGVALT